MPSLFDVLGVDDITSRTPSPPQAKKRHLGAVANDMVIAGVNMAAGGFGAAANFVAPGNPLSQGIESFVRSGEEMQSDAVKAGRQEYQSDLEAAQGPGDELAAVAKYVARNPLIAAAQAAGSFVGPGMAIKGTQGLARAAGAGAQLIGRAGLAGGALAGAAMAGGDAAGQAYELAKKAGASEEDAVAAARQASVIPAAIGGAGGLVGAERVFAGAGGFAGGALARAAKTGLVEGAQEAVEEGATNYEGRRAAMPFDPSIDPMKGTAAAAGMGFALGGATGAAVGAMSPAAEVQKAQATQRLAQADNVADMISAANDLAAAPLDIVRPEPAVELDAFGDPVDTGEPAQSFDEGSAVLVDPGANERRDALISTLQDRGNLEQIREKLGDEAVGTIAYYAQQANRTDIPPATAERMLELAEMIVSRALARPITGAPQAAQEPMQAIEARQQGLIGMEPGPARIEQDVSRTGTIRVDAAGNAAPETRADQINSNQAQQLEAEALAAAQGERDMLGQQARKASAVNADPNPRRPAPPVNMPERRRTDAVEMTPPDPVATYISDIRKTNTPAARAFIQDLNAGRITRQDIVRVMQTQTADPMASIQQGQAVDPVQQRIERAAAQAPAPAAGIEPARVYRTRSAAFVEARKTGGTVQPAAGGFIVSTGEANAQPDMAVPAGLPAGASDARAPDAGGSRGDLGLEPDGNRGRVAGLAPAPVVGGRAADAAGFGDQRDQALRGANEATAEAQADQAAKAPRSATSAGTGVPAARGAGDVQAAGLSFAANGKPYASKSIAFVRARRQGGTPVEVPGGWAVELPNQTKEPAPAQPVAGQKIDNEWTAFSKESGTKEVPRAEMPQIKAEHRGAMTQFLAARGIAHEQSEVPAAELKPTQAEFSPAKVAQAKEFSEGDRSILVSSDGFILDGHHQWLAKREAGETVKVIRLDAPIDKLMAEVKEFPSAQVGNGASSVEGEGGTGPQDTQNPGAETEQKPAASRAKRDTAPRPQSTGLPLQLAEKFANAYGAAGLQRVNVARNIGELPSDLRKKLSAYGDDVRGAYFPREDEIWVFSDKVSTPDELHFVVMHEAFHRGLGSLLGDNSKRLLRQMYATNKKLRDRADMVARELKIGKDEAIEEALADMAGEGQAQSLRGWSRLAKLITDWLNTIGEAVGIKRTYSDKDLESFVSAMSRAGINEDPDTQSLRDGFDPDKVNQEPGEGVKASRAAAMPLPADEPNTAAAVNAKAGWKLETPTRLENLVYEIQDKLIDTKRAVQAIKDAGQKIGDEFNPYLQEELYHGRAAKQTADFLDQEVRPLMADMARLGVSMESLEQYLHARHAEERNEQIATINPDMQDGGSGMKTADAQKYLAALSGPERARLDKLAARVDAITSGTRAYLVETGLESREAVKAWEGAYKNYVPLQRADVDADGSLRGTGTGFSVKGSASKRAMGSDREVDNILANVMMQRERAITRAEKNRVATAVYGLAIKAPNKGFWMPVDPDANQRTPAEMKALEAELVSLGLNPADAESVLREPKQRYVDPSTGLVAERINPAVRSSDNVLALRVNGKDRFVFFSDKDPSAARMVTALKNLDAPQMGEMMGLAAKITRYFSAINTSYNPIFGIVNLIRDFQSALFNQSTTAIAGQEKEVARHVPAALKGIMLSLRARRAGESTDSSWGQLFDEFEKAGGRTGYRDMYATAKDRASALEKEIKRASSAEGKGISAFKAGFALLEDYNDTMENALRLSAYKVAKDRGLTPEQAASLAKNLTVNFNRKGHLTSQVGALYAFFNASAQGTARLVETMKGPRGKKILVGGMLLGAVQALLLSAAGFDDGQPPDFVRERNFIVPIGDGKYLTVPMPLGLHVIPNLTRIPVEWALGGFKKPGERITSLLGLLFDTFNPIGSAGMSIQTVAPTILDPFVALSENRDFSGRAIAKDDFGANETPGFTRKRDTASAWGEGISYAVNWLTGGTDFKPGAFSPTPDQIDYLLGQVTGGVGREAAKVSQTLTSLYDGTELPAYKVPLFGRLYGDTTDSAAVSGTYYASIRDMNLHAQEVKGRRESGESVAEYLQENPEVQLAPLAKETEKRVGNLRKLRRAMAEREDTTDDQLQVIDRRIRSEMERFNARMKEVRETTD